jgi:hypothetical protein
MGSGRRPGFATTLDDFYAVDLRHLRRHGCLVPGRTGTLRWSRRGRETGRIGFSVGRDALVLSYRVSSRGGADAEDVEERVPLVRTAPPLGGERLWLACPGCGRRCAVLYGGRRFRCRRCVAAPYGSQREPRHERLLRRVQALRERLGGAEYASLGLPFPPRPKRMRQATYARLRTEAEAVGRAMAAAAAERFGGVADEFEDLF